MAVALVIILSVLKIALGIDADEKISEKKEPRSAIKNFNIVRVLSLVQGIIILLAKFEFTTIILILFCIISLQLSVDAIVNIKYRPGKMVFSAHYCTEPIIILICILKGYSAAPDIDKWEIDLGEFIFLGTTLLVSVFDIYNKAEYIKKTGFDSEYEIRQVKEFLQKKYMNKRIKDLSKYRDEYYEDLLKEVMGEEDFNKAKNRNDPEKINNPSNINESEKTNEQKNENYSYKERFEYYKSILEESGVQHKDNNIQMEKGIDKVDAEVLENKNVPFPEVVKNIDNGSFEKHNFKSVKINASLSGVDMLSDTISNVYTRLSEINKKEIKLNVMLLGFYQELNNGESDDGELQEKIDFVGSELSYLRYMQIVLKDKISNLEFLKGRCDLN